MIREEKKSSARIEDSFYQFLYLLPKGKRYKVNQVDTKAFAFVTPDQFLY